MRSTASRRVPWLAMFVIAATVSVCSLSGCQDPLFPADAPRTQFETYDRMRNNYSPADQPDVFGRPQPALRERLSPS